MREKRFCRKTTVEPSSISELIQSARKSSIIQRAIKDEKHTVRIVYYYFFLFMYLGCYLIYVLYYM